MSTVQDFSGYKPTWCPGCGNWGISVSIKSALVQLNLSPSSIFVVFGIGCSGNMNDFLNSYSIHSLHGRAIPSAIGMKIANNAFKTLVVGGDGDIYGEGGNHFLHGARGNHDITIIVHDNRVYGLTTGQVSPTADRGFRSKSTPQGTLNRALDPLSLALTQGATFVAQAFAGDVTGLTKILKLAIAHKGFSFVNVLQPCVSFNKVNTYKYYLEKIVKLKKIPQEKDRSKAVEFVLKIKESQKFPIGVIYETREQTYDEGLSQLKDGPLVKKKRFVEFDKILGDFE